MKTNRYIVYFLPLLLLSLLSGQSYGQITTSAWAQFINVDSYAGKVSLKEFSLQIAITTNNVNISDWGLQVKLNGDIRNSEGKVFDPSKIKIRINEITSPGPTKAQIGAIEEPVLSQQPRVIIPKSLAPLRTTAQEYHKQFVINFDIIIEGGSYLQALKSNRHYPLNLSFLIIKDNVAISTATTTDQIQVNPSGTPPVDPVYSIQVNSDAINGKLEFKSISDYVNGVSQNYDNGLSVVSNTPYALQVKAQSAAFESLDGSIPLNTVSLNLKAVNNGSIVGTVQLSNANQTIINNVTNTGTQARAFDIRYFTSPNDVRLQNAKPDTYKTTLIYTMIPQ